jgi:outer membrane protein OmpA-like peptidoglycan-associated protein
MPGRVRPIVLLVLVVAQLAACRWIVPQRDPAPEPVAEPPVVVVEPEETVDLPQQEPTPTPRFLPHGILVLDADDVEAGLEQYRRALLDAGRAALAPEDLGYFLDVLEARLVQRLAGTGIRFDRARERVRLTLPAEAIFASGSVRLGTEVRAALDIVGAAIAEFDRTLLSVHGHTDSTGPAEINHRISEQRALAVARYLVDHEGVSANIAIAGYGSSSPVADNDTPEGRELNRRVELWIDPLVRDR